MNYYIIGVVDDTVDAIKAVRNPFHLELDTLGMLARDREVHFSTNEWDTYAVSWNGALVSLEPEELQTLIDKSSDNRQPILSQLEVISCLVIRLSEKTRAVKKLMKNSEISLSEFTAGAGCQDANSAVDSTILERWLWQKRVEYALLDQGLEFDLNVPRELETDHNFWQGLGILTKLRLEAFKSLLNLDDKAALQVKLDQLQSSPLLLDKYKLAALIYCLYSYFPAQQIGSGMAEVNEMTIPFETIAGTSFTLNFVSKLPERKLEVNFSTPLIKPTGDWIDLASVVKDGVALLDFWGTWCKPCLRDAPRLDSLADDMTQHNVQVISIAIDEPKKWRRYIEKKNESKVVHLLSKPHGESVLDPAPNIFPTYVFVNSNGDIISDVFHDVDDVIGFLDEGG